MDTSILSVGIDIGTSTTGLIISRLNMANEASFFTIPRISINKKEIIYKSEIYKTPLINSTLIDVEGLEKIIRSEYEKANVRPSDIQSGAVIITGESARKENSENVADFLSEFAGDFVVATAGPDLESIIAGKGSGAQSHSDENGCVTANLDIGGGTTNIAVFQNGDLIGKGCVDIGGQLIRIDENNDISYIAPSVMKLAGLEGIKLNLGMKADIMLLSQIAKVMADALAGAFEPGKRNDLFKAVRTNGSCDFHNLSRIDGVFLSGGVGDCFYRQETDLLKYGDIGVLLAEAIKKSSIARDYRVLKPKETIRATVVGAGVYSVTVSGSTIDINKKWLPVKNVPVLVVNPDTEAECCEGKAERLSSQIKWFSRQNDNKQMVLSFKGRKDMQYREICNMAQSIVSAAENSLEKSSPIMVVVENDIAKSLGQVIKRTVKGTRGVICIDEIKAEEGDYIDMGKPVMSDMVIPVVIKTLVFG